MGRNLIDNAAEKFIVHPAGFSRRDLKPRWAEWALQMAVVGWVEFVSIGESTNGVTAELFLEFH